MAFGEKDIFILPTENKVNALRGYSDLSLLFNHKQNYAIIEAEKHLTSFFHLYLTDFSPIKNGEWYIRFILDPNNWDKIIPDKVVKANLDETNEFLVEPFSKYCRKIVATTDMKLDLTIEKLAFGTTIPITGNVFPSFKPSFIQHFIQYNNVGRLIKKVMVDHNEPCCKCDTIEKLFDCCFSVGDVEGSCSAPNPNNDFYGFKVKVDLDNLVDIQLPTIEDTLRKDELYTKKELIAFAEKYAKMVQSKPIQLNAYKSIHNINWINQNL
jgi:hypothetical protein